KRTLVPGNTNAVSSNIASASIRATRWARDWFCPMSKATSPKAELVIGADMVAPAASRKHERLDNKQPLTEPASSSAAAVRALSPRAGRGDATQSKAKLL